MESNDLAGFQSKLEDYLGRHVEAPLAVSRLRPMAGGASRAIWSFDLKAAADGKPTLQPLVLRMDSSTDYLEGSPRTEFDLMRLAFQNNVPVPEVLWFEDDVTVLGNRFFIMRFVHGETLVKRLHEHPKYAGARDRIVDQLGAALAQIHRIDLPEALTKGDALKRLTPEEAVRNQEAIFRRVSVEPHPVVEYGLRWLMQHVRPATGMTLVHGDYRVGNVIFNEDGLCAVLDWELAAQGDPLGDLAWITIRSWRFGRDEFPVGGVGTREEFHEAYQRAGGTRVDPERIFFWEVFGNVKWAIITISQVGIYLQGSPSLELASLGRRTAEIEWEILHLLDSPGG